jgi:hypothetical protein
MNVWMKLTRKWWHMGREILPEYFSVERERRRKKKIAKELLQNI